MLTELQAKNFKSWQDTGLIQIAPLTGFFGTNSSGKTAILQLLLMLKQTVESTNRKQVLFLGDEKSYVNLGNYKDVVYNHQTVHKCLIDNYNSFVCHNNSTTVLRLFAT